ncbi:hypothetical protein AAMO2058_000165800 [Amorphochlora amoebiformis]
MDATLIATLVATNIATAAVIYFSCSSKPSQRVNTMIGLDKAKVVHFGEAKKIAEENESGNVAYCRCWKSKKFPFCDGAHNGHNKSTGDNVGPLVFKKL